MFYWKKLMLVNEKYLLEQHHYVRSGPRIRNPDDGYPPDIRDVTKLRKSYN